MAALVHQSLTNCQALPLHARFTAPWRPGLLARLSDTLRVWRGRMRERHELALLDSRDLHDMGLSSSDVWHEISQPFWRAPPPC